MPGILLNKPKLKAVSELYMTYNIAGHALFSQSVFHDLYGLSLVILQARSLHVDVFHHRFVRNRLC
jgi:hypothetical protein